MKRIIFWSILTIAATTQCLRLDAAPAVPATRGYVTALVDQEARDRAAALQTLRARLLVLEADFATTMAAVRELSAIVASNELVQAEVATNFTAAAASITAAMHVASSNIVARVDDVERGMRVAYATSWADRRVIQAHLQGPSTGYTLLEGWPAHTDDAFVRQYLAVVHADQAGALEVPADYLTDLDNRVEPGYNLIMITDLAQFRFLQVRGVHSAAE